jgi:hypothetical protein
MPLTHTGPGSLPFLLVPFLLPCPVAILACLVSRSPGRFCVCPPTKTLARLALVLLRWHAQIKRKTGLKEQKMKDAEEGRQTDLI